LLQPDDSVPERELGRFVLTWAAWTEMFSNCEQPMSFQPLRHTPFQQATLQTLAGKSSGNGSDNLNQDRS